MTALKEALKSARTALQREAAGKPIHAVIYYKSAARLAAEAGRESLADLCRQRLAYLEPLAIALLRGLRARSERR
jgi:hypothetical protein